MSTPLAEVEIFRPLPDDAREALAMRGQRRRYAAGEVLMRQGDPSEVMHVVLTGRVRVEREQSDEGKVLLAEIGPNEVIGEMGVLDHAPRSATVTAMEPTETLELHATALAVVLIQYPAVAAVLLRTLSQRLRGADDLVEQLARESH
ncbi:MAG TPA: cyclic nucleotide-binding domain-containing protein [Candidatus Limnocylindria bacterium]|jgi:CRP-like cAMP-binding protein|nr:cyclic nucleotide-binding domain-containing protein [Candidatus Limnocylindria bacterium]